MQMYKVQIYNKMSTWGCIPSGMVCVPFLLAIRKVEWIMIACVASYMDSQYRARTELAYDVGTQRRSTAP